MLELALGQYMSIGSVEAWARLVPAFKGKFTYSNIFAYILHYLQVKVQ